MLQVRLYTHFMGDDHSNTKPHKLLYLGTINKNNLQIEDSRLQNKKKNTKEKNKKKN